MGDGVITVLSLRDASMPTPEDLNPEKLPHLLASNPGGVRGSDDGIDHLGYRGGQSF
jgi:hypothetical protein